MALESTQPLADNQYQVCLLRFQGGRCVGLAT